MEHIETLEFNPLIKELVIKQLQLEYEEYASNPTEQQIINQYNYLRENNKLHLLYEAEHLSSEERLKRVFSY